MISIIFKRKLINHVSLQSLAMFNKITIFDSIDSIIFIKNVLYKLKTFTNKLEAKEFNIIEGNIKLLENINKDSDVLTVLTSQLTLL